jgi:hypothetical protein
MRIASALVQCSQEFRKEAKTQRGREDEASAGGKLNAEN